MLFWPSGVDQRGLFGHGRRTAVRNLVGFHGDVNRFGATWAVRINDKPFQLSAYVYLSLIS